MGYHIKMTIAPDGSTCETVVEGLAGPGCQDVTRDIESKCGQRLSHKHTAEFATKNEPDLKLDLDND